MHVGHKAGYLFFVPWMIGGMVAACQAQAGPAETAAPPLLSWSGDSTYYDPNAKYGPKGITVLFEMKFDPEKWSLDDGQLQHIGSDCRLVPREDRTFGEPFRSIFGVDPYVGIDRYRPRETAAAGRIRFISLGMGTKHGQMHFGYCHDDPSLPVCFVVVSSDMYMGNNQERTEYCVPDTEAVLATLTVSAAPVP